jgi:hypothetical protein
MMKIIEIKTEVVKFLQENIHCQEITIVKLDKIDEHWEAVAEVYEDDSFLKSMNMPPKRARVFYSVKVDDHVEVIAYERLTDYPH